MKFIEYKYTKLVVLILLILLPFISFYIGALYQKSISPTQTVETEKVYDQEKQEDKNITDNNRDRSCGKSTIIITKLNVGLEEAKQYFENNKLSIVEMEGYGYGQLIVDTLPAGDNDEYWIGKIKADGIGEAAYDTIACDFID